MEYFNVRMTFRTRKIGEKVIFRLLSVIYILHIMICSPDQLSSAVPAVHLPCPLYLFLALLREVAEYLLCCPLPCRVFLGFDSIVTPILNVLAILIILYYYYSIFMYKMQVYLCLYLVASSFS